MNPLAKTILLLVLSLPAGLFAAGLDDWQAEKEPRLRIAASPYENYLLHILPTPMDFGEHLYRVRIDTLGMGPSDEVGRGHLYTVRGGFLDLAHIRRSIDFTAYVHHCLVKALEAGERHIAFESIDRTTYHVDIVYPAFWSSLEEREKARLIGEIALRGGAEASFDFSNWREILTWHGFHNVPGMPEKGSAFSYEDVVSHAVGETVALRAIRSPKPFDEAVTEELDRELASLGVVPEADYRRAMDLVAGKWWGKKTCLKRHLDIGLGGGLIEPWLVRGLFPGKPPRPRLYPGPDRDWRRVGGRDCRGMVTLSCEPRARRREILDRVLPEGQARVVPSRDYPMLLKEIEREVKAELGPHATVPYP